MMIMRLVTNRLEPAGCRVKAATSLIAFKGAVTLISTTISLSSPTTTLIASTTSLSSPKVFLILFLSSYSYKPWVMMSACCWGGAVLHKWQWPKLGLEWPPLRAQPSSSFPGLCVYTQVRLLHTFSFFRIWWDGKVARASWCLSDIPACLQIAHQDFKLTLLSLLLAIYDKRDYFQLIFFAVNKNRLRLLCVHQSKFKYWIQM